MRSGRKHNCVCDTCEERKTINQLLFVCFLWRATWTDESQKIVGITHRRKHKHKHTRSSHSISLFICLPPTSNFYCWSACDFFLLGVPPCLSVIGNMAATAAASAATSEFNQDETHFDFFHAFAAIPLLLSPRLTRRLPAPHPLLPSP